ncbi:MAG: prepilin-type N-terminal cleavage/methylation domain-containing protein [Candidatus Aminicenantes bacterium]|jgi:general secretion pathway protein G|nr:prepilin-type N-terminal cleavage/methylation domain-containing protein [Candidatus Aminicenantes bacterium]
MREIFRRPKGFTLTEMLVAAAILAILAAAALPLSKIAIQRENEIELRRNLRLIREAIDSYKKLADEKKIEFEADTEGYPSNLELLVKGVKLKSEGKDKKGEEKLMKFLRRIPRDPMTKSADWGLLSTQDAPDAAAWGEQNVFDVYTKSRRKALDGTKYRDW